MVIARAVWIVCALTLVVPPWSSAQAPVKTPQAPVKTTQAGWTLGPFSRPADAPVISPKPQSIFTDPITGKSVHWEALHTFNPAAIVRDGRIYVLYRAEDDSGPKMIGGHTSRLGLAESEDGIHFKRLPIPVFYPDHDSQQENEVPGGVEDPRIVEREDGLYVLTYTQWARDRDVYTVGVATSRDLRTWSKQGKAFGSEGRYAALKYKSAAILTHRVGDRLIAAKVKGKYWMYWGEIQIRLATSTDLIHWTPVEDASGNPVELLKDRPGLFDSAFPESGPPPLLTAKGVVMLYNAKNSEKGGDPKLAPGTYSVGQALFSADDPGHRVARTDEPVFKPERPYERSGQYVAGTTFAEGLVLFKHRLYLYYGCADSHVGVATAPEPEAVQ
ncbi:MAG TPA: glycoside hydrolase family 130 protein [Edaphobacter sp.]|nr:glycoside hydrolase family 130 protein [Edaphobacter sp.]